MPIDGCKHSFKTLATDILPRYMQRLQDDLQSPEPMSRFARDRVGPATLAKELKRPSDFQGCYVLIEKKTPCYIGISRSVLSRLRQHVRGRSHFDASLAYRMACNGDDHGMKRAEAMKTEWFRKEFDKAQKRIQRMNAVFVEITNDLELHVFEAYAAMELKTAEWNTFRTH
ncbi:MAG: GIY-YIG nuclease family protein [Phycisphaeraceae bacterium]